MKFHVPDMSCNHCVSSITKAVAAVSPQAQVMCDLPNHLVQIDLAGELSPETLQQAMKDVGFDSTLVQAQA